MAGLRTTWWLQAVLLAVALSAGCTGPLLEYRSEDGRSDRVMIDQPPSWRDFDRSPVQSGEFSIMLKSQQTF